ncbi:hypothetical protein [Sporosarcina sp. PTS2304]|uniref:hypothetical protein n=1 Tax=Sporosarcina sp. PTS2304 TaxID=2283194 RepID=UPI0013B416DD|nr:hypothetical protein [Sporosarcina sp. PTS2304]
MLKRNFTFALLFFVLITAWKWVSTSEIQWLENIMLTIGITLVTAFIDWASKPYQYKKSND